MQMSIGNNLGAILPSWGKFGKNS